MSRTTNSTTIAALVLIAIVVVAGLARLGFWQLDRANDKQALIDSYAAAAAEPAQDWDGNADLPEFSPVYVTGSWSTPAVFLDNQSRNKMLGAHVYRGLKLAGSERNILLNLGWVALAENRELPAVDFPPDGSMFQGLLVEPPEGGLRLGQQSTVGWTDPPFRAPYVDIDQWSQALESSLATEIILVTDESSAFVRDWQPVVMPPSRHHGYAFQWFSLAATLSVITGWLLYRRSARADTRIK